MRAPELLQHLHRAGFTVGAEGERLLVTSPTARLCDEDRAAIIANKAELLRLAAAAELQACKQCQHRSRRGTCLDPVAAGLAERFRIEWPPEGHAQRCAAFTPLGPAAPAQETAPSLSQGPTP